MCGHIQVLGNDVHDARRVVHAACTCGANLASASPPIIPLKRKTKVIAVNINPQKLM